ncbi:MAG: hypothetical protein HKN67_09620 [Saprospiraceae bacterium]|nr:hypothetical protein [Saprospiraceae bacterium]
MKKLIALLFLGAFLSNSIIAQDPGKDLKNAEKSLKQFITDETKLDQLNEGMRLLESAFTSSEISGQAKSWLTKGKIFNEVANAEFKRKTIDPAYQLASEDAAIKAFKAFAKANEITTKKNDLKTIENGVTEVESHLNNFAIFAYQAQEYNAAFDNFKTSIEAYELLKSMDKKSRLDDAEMLLTDQYFFAGVSGYYAQRYDEVAPYLQKLYEDDSEEAFVYEALYNMYRDSDSDKAKGYLDKGRMKFPDDTGLLFAEINHYLKNGELDKLISKLELALEKEPDNVSIYNTLGSVYDQLHQKEREAGNEEKAQEYFNKALEYYNLVLAKDESNFDATYSVGALHYNKAATYVDVLNELAADLTTAGMKKYDATKVEMDEIFNKALPFFLKAEGLNGSDMNTLIALKEIYARLNDLEKSESYKMKMENLSSGQ